MELDFPAAHSMDTDWFAVDRDGHVAVFDTGESGHVPEGTGPPGNGDAPYDLLDWHTPPGPRVDPRRHLFLNVAAELARMGVFYFYYELQEVALEWSPRTIHDVPFYARYGLSSRDFTGPYVRALLPAELLHVDQLPPELRRRAKQFRFTEVSFSEQEFVQPAEHFACSGWGGGLPPAYLCGDGKTLRPWPGKKNAFGRFIGEFLAADPRRAEWFAFEWSPGDSRDPPG